jgi:hypothetical protein
MVRSELLQDIAHEPRVRLVEQAVEILGVPEESYIDTGWSATAMRSSASMVSREAPPSSMRAIVVRETPAAPARST